MDKIFKYSLFPDLEQEDQFLAAFSHCTIVYNELINLQSEYYGQNNKLLSFRDCVNQVYKIRGQREDLRYADGSALLMTIGDLLDDIRRSQKAGEGYPLFKPRSRMAFKLSNVAGDIEYHRRAIYLPKYGWVAISAVEPEIEGYIKNVLIYYRDDAYYISILCSDTPFTNRKKNKSKDQPSSTEKDTSDEEAVQDNVICGWVVDPNYYSEG